MNGFMEEINKFSSNYETFETSSSDVMFLTFTERQDNIYLFYQLDKTSLENFDAGSGKMPLIRITAQNDERKAWLDDMAHTSGLMMVNKKTNRFYTISQMALVPIATAIEAGSFGKERGKIPASPIRDMWLAKAFFDYKEDYTCNWIARTETVGNITTQKIFFMCKGGDAVRSNSQYVPPDMSLLVECVKGLMACNPDYADVIDWNTGHKSCKVRMELELKNGKKIFVNIEDSDTGTHSFWSSIDLGEESTPCFKKSWHHRYILNKEEILSTLNSEINNLGA